MARSKNIKRWFLVIFALLLVIGAVTAALELTDTTHLFHAKTNNSGVNYGPPTQAEKNDSESHKDNTPDTSSDNPVQNSVTKKKVSVEITTFSSKTTDNNVSVNGFVTDVVESGGTCTLTLTDTTGKKVTGTHPGEANASNTTCGETTVSISSLHAGTWKAVLSYSSATSTGTSDAVDIKVD